MKDEKKNGTHHAQRSRPVHQSHQRTRHLYQSGLMPPIALLLRQYIWQNSNQFWNLPCQLVDFAGNSRIWHRIARFFLAQVRKASEDVDVIQEYLIG